MARSTPVTKAWRSLAWLLVIIIGLAGINVAGILASGANVFDGQRWAPKLALDLEGGTQIILAPKLASGQTVSDEQLNQAVAIMRQRIDASGVSESEITTQGSGNSSNVIVSIPGVPTDEQLARIESSAKLEFRAVLLTDAASASSVGETPTPTPTPGATDTPAPTATPTDTPTATPTDGSDPAWITPGLQSQFDTFDCSSVLAGEAGVAPADQPLVTCDPEGTAKYLLGPVEVAGETISDASANLVSNSQGVSTGEWAVNIKFNAKGGDEFQKISTRLIALDPPRNQFAAVLDGNVITAPRVLGVTTDPQITGSFDQTSSKSLADQLKFGALPISFETQSRDVISATLGSSQLLSGLLAGLIGLILVVIYSLVQYRALASVTIASLIIAGIITYLLVTVLSWREGYRLSLAGVAGLIVAIGITADSFIVYFERIRDELRDGRGLESAVEAGWKRAIRTILASDTVNFLAAVILFILAVGNVRGFALTLGLTTLIDVVVVALFTHPVLQLISRTRFFAAGHPLSGLDPKALGAVYRGRAQFITPTATGARTAAASREAARRQTIAERKAAEAAAAGGKAKDS